MGAINEEIVGNTGYMQKSTKEGLPVLMGEPAEFRQTSLRKHLQKRAAQDTRDYVFWEFLYRRFVEVSLVREGARSIITGMDQEMLGPLDQGNRS